jgi:hypothetical protein
MTDYFTNLLSRDQTWSRSPEENVDSQFTGTKFGPG